MNKVKGYVLEMAMASLILGCIVSFTRLALVAIGVWPYGY